MEGILLIGLVLVGYLIISVLPVFVFAYLSDRLICKTRKIKSSFLKPNGEKMILSWIFLLFLVLVYASGASEIASDFYEAKLQALLLFQIPAYLLICLVFFFWEKAMFSRRAPIKGVVIVLFSAGAIGLLALIATLTYKPTQAEFSAKGSLETLRAVAEMHYDINGGYSGLSCDTNGDTKRICAAVYLSVDANPTIYASEKAYCAFVKRPRNDYIRKYDYYCVDSSGADWASVINPGEAGYCDGITFVCPPGK